MPPCSSCGAVPNAGDTFCAKCGKPLGEQTAPAAPSVLPANAVQFAVPQYPAAKANKVWMILGIAALGVALWAGMIALIMNASPAANGAPPTPTMPFALSGVTTTWRLDSGAYAGVSGGLWVPEVQFTIQNTQQEDIGPIYFRGRFSDSTGTLEGDDVTQTVEDVPAGYKRGPIFVDGGQGYTSDYAFLSMIQNASTLWQYQLFYATSYGGPYALLESGSVELPANYRQLGGQ